MDEFSDFDHFCDFPSKILFNSNERYEFKIRFNLLPGLADFGKIGTIYD